MFEILYCALTACQNKLQVVIRPGRARALLVRLDGENTSASATGGHPSHRQDRSAQALKRAALHGNFIGTSKTRALPNAKLCLNLSVPPLLALGMTSGLATLHWPSKHPGLH